MKNLSAALTRAAASLAAAGALTLSAYVPPAHAAVAQKNQGLQGGWSVDDGGNTVFYHSLATQYGSMREAGAGWVRINFRLGACYPDWTSVGCNGRTARQAYADVVAEARRHNLKVLGLLSNESMHTPGADAQTQWTANAFETTGGSGDNPYITGFASNVAGQLADHFDGVTAPLVEQWQVWNEPNAWTATLNGNPWGGTFMYQSNYAQLLKKSYDAIKTANPGAAVVAAGVLGHDQGGVSANVLERGSVRTVTKRGDLTGAARPSVPTHPLPPEEPGAPDGAGRPTSPGGPSGSTSAASGPAATATATCATAYADVATGADYLCTLFQRGIQLASWRSGAYPMDHVAQHIYVDVGGRTSSQKLAKFLSDFRNAQVYYEGSATAKKLHVTEIGWRTDYVSPKTQATNLQISFQQFKGTSYVGRGYWFNVQDIPEGGLYYGLEDGDGVNKQSFRAFQQYANY